MNITRPRVVGENELPWGSWDFPGSLVARSLPSSAESVGLIPGKGAKIPHASPPTHPSIKQKQYCNKLNKDFKMVYIRKNFLQKQSWGSLMMPGNLTFILYLTGHGMVQEV